MSHHQVDGRSGNPSLAPRGVQQQIIGLGAMATTGIGEKHLWDPATQILWYHLIVTSSPEDLASFERHQTHWFLHVFTNRQTEWQHVRHQPHSAAQLYPKLRRDGGLHRLGGFSPLFLAIPRTGDRRSGNPESSAEVLSGLERWLQERNKQWCWWDPFFSQLS